MPILRLADGQKRLLLSLHGVRQHKWLFLGNVALSRGDDDRSRSMELSAPLAEP